MTDTIRRWSVDRFVVFSRGRMRIDWMQPIPPLYARVLATAEARPWLAATLRVATAGGLILTKLVACRKQDQSDIETLLTVNATRLDLSVIRDEWAPYADAEPARTAWFEAAAARLVPPRG